MTATIATKKLSASVGAEVLDVDRDRLLGDPDLPEGLLDALEEHGVLVFPEIGVITQTPDNPMAEYLKGNAQWHIDGALDDIPSKAGILSARVITAGDSGTEFASTYAAYDDLGDDEQEHLAGLRVVHTMEATLREVYDDPTPEQLATWRQRRPREH